MFAFLIYQLSTFAFALLEVFGFFWRSVEALGLSLVKMLNLTLDLLCRKQILTLICIYSSVTFDMVLISKAGLCLIPVAVSKWFLDTPFLLGFGECHVLAVWHHSAISMWHGGDIPRRRFEGRKVHADTISTLPSLPLIQRTPPLISRDFTVLLFHYLWLSHICSLATLFGPHVDR